MIGGEPYTGERFFAPRRSADRGDTLAFIARALRVDDTGVIRLRRRESGGQVELWVQTGFDVLATRVVFGEVNPPDLVVDAQTLQAALRSTGDGAVDPGFTMAGAWRGALPGSRTVVHLDDVPARTLVELSRSGRDLAMEPTGGHGPVTSLLDQTVLEVSGDDPAAGTAEISLRSVFALTAMGFVRTAEDRPITDRTEVAEISPTEPVRIRLAGNWVRLDARFGTVFARRGPELSVTPV